MFLASETPSQTGADDPLPRPPGLAAKQSALASQRATHLPQVTLESIYALCLLP
jgi:hypothetical protein